MSGYMPRREDLEAEPMSSEWRDVADSIQPFNIERLIDQGAAAAQEFNEAMIRVNVTIRDGVTPVLERFAASLRALLDPRRRHRTGHRHRGTRDHRLRYAPGRPDLPLGQRTIAKARYVPPSSEAH